MVLMLSKASNVLAQEITAPTAPALVPSETEAEAAAEQSPEAAEQSPETAEDTGMVLLPPDPGSAIYQICDRMAQDMEARHLFVYHTGTNQVLYSKTTGNGKLFPASITKLFSTYVALQYLDPDEIITAGSELELVHEGSSMAYVGEGSQLRVKMLVEGMMLPSGNDAAMVLAAAAGRVIAQDEALDAADAVQVFVDEMNRQADLLGFEMSHFTSPDGWHTGSHYTCLNDMARIAKLALSDKTIARYMRTGEEEVTFLSGQTKKWKNTNLLVVPEEGFYRYDAIGMKTGYTRQAEYCLMSAFRLNDGRNLVIGLFGYGDTYKRFNDANKLAKACKDWYAEEAKAAKEAEKEANQNGTP